MLLATPNIFMGYSVCLIFDLQWAPGLDKIEVSSTSKLKTVQKVNEEFGLCEIVKYRVCLYHAKVMRLCLSFPGWVNSYVSLPSSTTIF
jgi:hypothetical protein